MSKMFEFLAPPRSANCRTNPARPTTIEIGKTKQRAAHPPKRTRAAPYKTKPITSPPDRPNKPELPNTKRSQSPTTPTAQTNLSRPIQNEANRLITRRHTAPSRPMPKSSTLIPSDINTLQKTPGSYPPRPASINVEPIAPSVNVTAIRARDKRALATRTHLRNWRRNATRHVTEDRHLRFPEAGASPRKYTCDEQNVSPVIEWTGAPPPAKPFALILDERPFHQLAAPQHPSIHAFDRGRLQALQPH